MSDNLRRRIDIMEKLKSGEFIVCNICKGKGHILNIKRNNK